MSICPVVYNHRRNSVSVANATAITAVDALGELFLSDLSTARAFLRGPARIDFLRFATSFLDFVACKGDQFSPSGVIYMLGEHPSGQAFNVEVFECDFSKPRCDIDGNFVQIVRAAAGGVRGERSEARLDLASALRSAFASSESALKSALLLRSLLGEVGAINHFAGRERNERRQAHVDADRCVVDGIGGGLNFDVEDHEPLAVLAREDRRLRSARKHAMPAHFDFAWNTDESDFAGLAQCEAVADTKVSGVVAGARLDTGETGLSSTLQATKKSGEGLLQIAQDLLLSAEGPARKIRLGDADSLKLGRLIVITQRNATLTISVDSLFKCSIVECAKIRKHIR